MKPGKNFDRDVRVFGGMIEFFRRRQDGYTRVEFYTHEVQMTRTNGNGKFTWYLNDEERRRVAEAFWPPPETGQDEHRA